MRKFNSIPGFTGSELERASMAGNVFPAETTLERAIKHKVANSLKQLADLIDPPRASDLSTRYADAQC